MFFLSKPNFEYRYCALRLVTSHFIDYLQIPNEDFNLISRKLKPTSIPILPLGITHCCRNTSDLPISRLITSKRTDVVSPGASCTFSKPRRTRVGLSLAGCSGKFRYNCGTAAPTKLPVFWSVAVIVKRTIHRAGFPPGATVARGGVGDIFPVLIAITDSPLSPNRRR